MKAVGAMVAGIIGLCGCAGGVPGDGHAKTEARSAAAFSAIDAETSLDVVVTLGDTPSLVVTTDENLIDDVVTEVIGGTLHITDRVGIDARVPSVVRVVTPSLDSATDRGSGDLMASVQAQTFTVAATGSGSVTLQGDANQLAIDVEGSGSLDATNVAARGADAQVWGSGSLSLAVSGDARLETSGSGSIDARLDDGSAWLSTTGSGSIRWTGDAVVASARSSGSGDIVHR